MLSSSPSILAERIRCSRCNDHTQFVSIHHAARSADVSPRTIYRYIEAGKIQFFRLAGTGHYRVCIGCLLGGTKRMKSETSPRLKESVTNADNCALTQETERYSLPT